ncbi:hypothetical protein OE09_2347 [Flavobacteriaceae bacterium MAR_2010_72]|nr:hypothetical protein OE09_2347 [Flavobacteriaceae bacterium MAR_2010_72]TVZ58944.1 hypothetical protein NA63_1459 [Flavobacteriaceae bacterium MAR_2010_105]
MRRNLLFCFLCAIGSNAIAQLAGQTAVGISEDAMSLPFPRSDYAQIVALSSAEVREVYNKELKTPVDGSPYLYDTWFNQSKVYFRDKVYNISSFNYNVYSDRFEAKLSKDSVLIINPEGVNKVVINNKTFERYYDPETQLNSYFEQLIKFNNYWLLKKYTKKVKSGSVNPLTKQKLTNDALVQDEVFYLSNENKLKVIKLNKSDIQSLFKKEHLEHVKNFVKNQGLNYKDEDDIKKIITYYNSL